MTSNVDRPVAGELDLVSPLSERTVRFITIRLWRGERHRTCVGGSSNVGPSEPKINNGGDTRMDAAHRRGAQAQLQSAVLILDRNATPMRPHASERVALFGVRQSPDVSSRSRAAA